MKRAFESVRAMSRRDWAVVGIAAALATTVLANKAVNERTEHNARAVMSPEFAYADSPAGIAMVGMQKLAGSILQLYQDSAKGGDPNALTAELQQGSTHTYGVTVTGVDASLGYKVATGHFRTDALYDVEATFVDQPGGAPIATAVTFITSEVASSHAAAFYKQTMASGGGLVSAVDLSARFGTLSGTRSEAWQAHARVGYPIAAVEPTDTFCVTPQTVEAFVQEGNDLLSDARAQNALQLPVALRELAVATG